MLFFVVFFVDFYCWDENLAKSQQNTKNNDKNHTAKYCENEVYSINKFEREEEIEL